ncbi:hypothetical protein [Persicirhabdus sediminis]|uniref:O-Antigen ligase n=1 Tax=Persicirhabdus sediminis TaxID=454144 RepID=A0A8J7MGZ3_9BACT|nr:hypothetical protein [Persicirhabdus sediminis]MBK1792770.1 hypothetical protein [Persicirhabdus sediminis]
MNHKIANFLLMVLLVFLGLYVMVSSIGGGGNEIGRLSIYFCLILFLIGSMSPKLGLYALLLLAGYSDMVKRFMVLGSSVSQLDVMYVLAMAPCVLGGAVSHVLIQRISKRQMTKGDFIRFGFASISLLGVAVSAILSGGGLGSLRVIADYGVFTFLVFILPIVFPSRELLLGYIKVALYIFIPVALYGIWQRLFGLADFEMDYLMTGLSRETRQLGQIGLRPFSTLNAASSLTIVMAACAMLTIPLRKLRMLNLIEGIGLFLIFTTACIMTFTRTGWVCLALFPIAVVALRYKGITILAYLVAFGVFIGVVLSADWFLNNLQGWQADISGEGDYGRSTQAFRVTTLYDRFLGFSNMKNPSNWAPFGVETGLITSAEYRYDDPTFSHDQVSRFLFKYGYVPSGIILIIGLVSAFAFHTKLLNQSWSRRKISTFFTGAVFSLFVSILAGTYIFQFPANIFLWMIVCAVIQSMDKDDLIGGGDV